MKNRMRNWWPATVWMGVIFATSSTFVSSKQWVGAVTTHGPVRMEPDRFQEFWNQWWWVFVKGYHVLEYSLLTALLMVALRGRTAWVALFAFLYACSDEFHQTFVPGRGGRWTDVAIDTIGIAAVCLVYVFMGSRAVCERRSIRSLNVGIIHPKG